MRQKGFAPIIILVLILLGVIGYFIYQNTQLQKSNSNVTSPSTVPNANLLQSSPTPDPTVNWKTYTNTKYGYSVKYPSNWEPNRWIANLSDEELAKETLVEFNDLTLPGISTGKDSGTGFQIATNELNPNGDGRNCSDLNDCFSKTFKERKESTNTTNRVSTTFWGQTAIIFNYQLKGTLYSQSFKYIYFIYQGNAYDMNISTRSDREKEVFGIFDQILSTFKFTD